MKRKNLKLRYEAVRELEDSIKKIVNQFHYGDGDNIRDSNGSELYEKILNKLVEIDMLLDRIEYIASYETGMIVEISDEIKEVVSESEGIFENAEETTLAIGSQD